LAEVTAPTTKLRHPEKPRDRSTIVDAKTF
jgi:hypothetical protein